ncbi:hypothetical protein BJ508DRAFT_412631 [Ascobolus immersus RN42]|uniref:Uncharacterized protein n=1 Tax=Ascobolus immersus RN42 TaxID=1160509 RepID=A0A3N4IIL8_ASCIM|nr:hypothetical protein BJ508DRAFT_412631 [Ascobolus immersus RN42]
MSSDAFETLADFFSYMSVPAPESSVKLPFPTPLVKELLIQHLYNRTLTLDDSYLEKTRLLEHHTIEQKCLALTAVCTLARTIPVVAHKLLYDKALEQLKQLMTDYAWSIPSWVWHSHSGNPGGGHYDDRHDSYPFGPRENTYRPEASDLKRKFDPTHLIGILHIVFGELLKDDPDVTLRLWVVRFTKTVVGDVDGDRTHLRQLQELLKLEDGNGAMSPSVLHSLLDKLTGDWQTFEPCIGCRLCDPAGELRYAQHEPFPWKLGFMGGQEREDDGSDEDDEHGDMSMMFASKTQRFICAKCLELEPTCGPWGTGEQPPEFWDRFEDGRSKEEWNTWHWCSDYPHWDEDWEPLWQLGPEYFGMEIPTAEELDEEMELEQVTEETIAEVQRELEDLLTLDIEMSDALDTPSISQSKPFECVQCSQSTFGLSQAAEALESYQLPEDYDWEETDPLIPEEWELEVSTKETVQEVQEEMEELRAVANDPLDLDNLFWDYHPFDSETNMEDAPKEIYDIYASYGIEVPYWFQCELENASSSATEASNFALPSSP